MDNYLKVNATNQKFLSGAELGIVQISFPSKLLKVWGFAQKDAIAYELESDKLIMEYKGHTARVARVDLIARLRGATISISYNRIPELATYNIPYKREKAPFTIEGNKLVLDLSQFKKGEVVGFKAIDTVTKPEVKRVAGFSELKSLGL
jgi:hypothetical protein